MTKRRFGLVGKDISYSFSKKYFNEKFSNENFDICTYENFDIQSINEFPEIITKNPDIEGLNITIPFKETIIPYLHKLSKKAAQIGAVNVVKITKKGNLKGYNSDYYGFKKSLKPLLKPHHKKALILGTGGAAKAVTFALDQLRIVSTCASRKTSENFIDYSRINATTFDNYQIIINCTPLGTSPNEKDFPPIPYEYFTEKHIAFDLIYNPTETVFLKKAKEKSAEIQNGYDMLVFQAEKGWKIWNK